MLLLLILSAQLGFSLRLCRPLPRPETLCLASGDQPGLPQANVTKLDDAQQWAKAVIRRNKQEVSLKQRLLGIIPRLEMASNASGLPFDRTQAEVEALRRH